jgi:hypothetical protein
MVRSRRPHRLYRSILRWISVALSALLVIGLLARGHALQAAGLPFGCEHPGEASAQSQTHGSADDKDCPPDCHRCACGQIAMTLSASESLPYVLLQPYELDDLKPAETPGHSIYQRLDRPPRRLDAF